MEKFKVFRLLDFLTFGVLALTVSLLSTYFTVYGENLTAQAIALMWVVAAAAWGVYGVLVVARAAAIAKISFVTKHGIGVMVNGFKVSQDEFENITEDTIKAWELATGWDDVRNSLNEVVVSFKTYPVKHRSTLGNLAGYTIGKSCVIGYKPSLNETALSHELGHVVHQDWYGWGDNTKAHEFMEKHKLR